MLTKKNWDVAIRDWWDRNPGRFSKVMDCVADMMANGRYVCTFATHSQRWALLEDYCYNRESTPALLEEVFKFGDSQMSAPCFNPPDAGDQDFGGPRHS